MTVEVSELRCAACGALGVAKSVLGVQVCSSCANIAVSNSDYIAQEVASAVVKVIKNYQPAMPAVGGVGHGG